MKLVRAAAAVLAITLTRSASAQREVDLVSTRALAMGNAGSWLRDDAVLFYNPAQLAVGRGTSLSGQYRRGGEHSGALSSASAFGNGGVAVGMTMYQVNLAPLVLTPDSIGSGPAEPQTEILGAAGIGQTIKGQRLGVAAKYDAYQFGDSRWSRTLVDVGIAHDFGRYVTGGLVAKDIQLRGGPPYGFNPYRTVAGLAVSGPVGPLDAVAALDMSSGPDLGWSTNLGVEAAWSWIAGYSIAARAGMLSPSGPSDHYTLGAGFARDRVSIDYAFERRYNDHAAYRIGLRIQ